MSTPGELGPLAQFLTELSENDELRKTWEQDARKAMEGRGLSPEQEEALTSRKFSRVRDLVMKEAETTHPGAFMLIIRFMRQTIY